MHPFHPVTLPSATGLRPQVRALTGWLLFTLLFGYPLRAQPVLVKDINLKSFTAPENLINVNGTLFFSMDDEISGMELWKSDGTEAGTVLVKDINPGPASSFLTIAPAFFTEVNGTLFFNAYTGTSGWELWKSDGTRAGTVMVKDIYPGYWNSSSDPNSAYPANLTNVNGTLFFAANDSTSSVELWKSDGTEAGTVLVKDINRGREHELDPINLSSDPGNLTNVNGTLFFTAFDYTGGLELWRSDGTEAGTVMVKDIYPGTEGSGPYHLTNVNGTLFFSAGDETTGRELWKSDGTSGGTVMVKEITPGPNEFSPTSLTNANGTLFFTILKSLWKSDGTEEGTVLVKEIAPGFDNPYPSHLTAVNGALFFRANDGTSGWEFWKSDGTSAGTVMIKDINPGPASSSESTSDNPYPSQLASVDGTLFFRANDGTSGDELWKSDGTSAGTVMIKDIDPGQGHSDPLHFAIVSGTLFFSADNGANGKELWKSDGTETGTVMVKDINPSNKGSDPEYLTNIDGTLFFKADYGTNGLELWKSDGTSAGTVMVKDINPGELSSHPFNLTNVKGTLFFWATDEAHGLELWKSDGTSAGTVMVRDIYPGMETTSPNESFPTNLTDVNGTLFFIAYDRTHGNELWKSDGTETGTVLVKDILPNASVDHFYRNFTNVNGTLFFTTQDGTSGQELWKSDGTSAGTVMVKDINPGPGSSTPQQLTNVNGTLFFLASGGALTGGSLWKSDGTAAGTVLVKEIDPGPGDSARQPLTSTNDTHFFVAGNDTNGAELWKSDGTSEGTVMVKDINPGSGSADPGGFAKLNGKLFFRADNGTDGYELWESDGTEAGTVMVKDINPERVDDINPGQGHSYPSHLINVNGTLFFRAGDGLRGGELWKYTPGEAPAPAAFRINAGGEAYTDGEGKVFIADQYANSGSLSAKVTGEIANTAEDELYRQGRIGERFTYTLPTGNGVYYVVLHFAETYWGNQLQGGAGSRSFHVDIEELRKLTDYDIYAKTGGSLRAVQEAFRVVVKDGQLDIRFSKGTADLPLVSAIEVFAQEDFRINVAGSAYYSSQGWYLSDFYGSGGSLSQYAPGDIAGTEDDEFYRSNRHGSLFNYNLPTGPGTFQVTLHFAETYWGNLVPGGAGSRRFNVNAEGQRRLSGYDTYAKAGAAMAATQEGFTVTVTDQVLNLAFLRGSVDASVDFAHLAAIQVLRLPAPTGRLAATQREAGEASPTALHPNPVKDKLWVRLPVPAGQVQATAITDARGVVLLRDTHRLSGENQLQLDVSALRPGLYLLRVESGQGSQLLRFVKQ